jgi:hypothetical protein
MAFSIYTSVVSELVRGIKCQENVVQGRAHVDLGGPVGAGGGGVSREFCRTWLSILTQAPQRGFAEEGTSNEEGYMVGTRGLL